VDNCVRGFKAQVRWLHREAALRTRSGWNFSEPERRILATFSARHTGKLIVYRLTLMMEKQF
jgi:hypothetical protein